MIVVAGHVCLDIIPRFESRAALDPGSLVRVGAATLSTGGVSNVGVALHRLGTPVKLIHRVGDDLFGSAIQSILSARSPELASGIRTVPGETTSYSVVVAPPGVDRMFIHCPGANDTFTADDIDLVLPEQATHLHFGYPPIMRGIYADGGKALSHRLHLITKIGESTSLDMCSVDPTSDAGRVDWRAWLKTVLPNVDLFTPSFDELSQMLKRPTELSADAVRTLARECLDLGAGSVLIKMGDAGLYYADHVQTMHAPCRKVEVVSTNGSGDCTIAGFLASRERRDPIERSLEIATAVGACCCEAPDATSGVHPLAEIETRLARGWNKLETQLRFD